MREKIPFCSISRKLRRNYTFALIALCPLLGIIWSIPFQESYRPAHEALNLFILVYLITILAFLAIGAHRVSSDLIWTSVVWLPLQSVVFFGIGPLVAIFGNEETQRALSNHVLAVNNTELYRSIVLSTTGVFMVIFGMYLHIITRRRAWMSVWRREEFLETPNFNPKAVGLFFIFLGGFFNYLIIKPNLWSDQPSLIPGFLNQIGGFTDIGFAIMAYLLGKGVRSARKYFLVFWPIHFLLTSLTFSKLELLLTMLLPIIGFLSASRKNLTSGILFFLLVAVYLIYNPIATHGRHLIYQETGTITQAGYLERFNIVSNSIFPNQESYYQDFIASSEEGQRSWMRLNYTGVQSAAMSLYDSGQANPQLHNAWMFFIPRVIWPNKPNMSYGAVEFYQLVTGNENVTSFLGISHYGDLYWQYGWMGVFVGAPMIGFFFSSMAMRSLLSVQRRDFVMLPAVLIALNLAILGPTGAVLNTVIGGGVIYFAYILLIKIVKSALISLGRGNTKRNEQATRLPA